MCWRMVVGVAAVLCLRITAAAQVNEVWSARFNGTANLNDGITAMAVDASGNVYVTGSTSGGAVSGNDFCAIKYTPTGDTAWVRKYNGTGNNNDIARSIVVDAAGNVYVTGESRNGSSFDTEDYVTIKYSPTGDSLWVRRYDGPGGKRDFPAKIGLDDSANVYVTGLSIGSASAMDITTIKYDTNGNEQWVRRWSGDATFAFSSAATGMVATGSGNVYITGHVNNQSTFWDFVTLKYDRDGTKKWHAYYAGPLDNVSEEATAIAIDANENVYVTGTNSQSQPVTIKYNSDGIEQWTTALDPDAPSPKSIAVDGSRNVYTGCENFVTVKFNSRGDSLWARKVGGANFNYFVASLAVNGDGKIFCAGRSGRSGSTDYDFLLVKLDQNGDTVWTSSFNGPASGNDEPSILTLANDGSVFVAGYSTGTGTMGDMYLIKYSESSTGFQDKTPAMPRVYALSQNYPNPFNPTTTIRYTLPIAGNVQLNVYNVLGQVVSTLVNTHQEPGSHSVTFDASQFSSGIYFYGLRAGAYAEMKRMILVK